MSTGVFVHLVPKKASSVMAVTVLILPPLLSDDNGFIGILMVKPHLTRRDCFHGSPFSWIANSFSPLDVW